VDLTDIQIARELLAKRPEKVAARAVGVNTEKEKTTQR
jgi:hypothetical protein